MASSFLGQPSGVLKQMIGHDITWACDKHKEPIRLYCESHKIAICHLCATKDHQKPCKLEDLEDVVKQMHRDLDERSLEIEKSQRHLRDFEEHITSCRKITSDYLRSLRIKVEATFGRRLQKEMEKEIEEVRVINEEAEEEIRVLNERRGARLEKCREDAERRLKPLRDSQSKLVDEINKISDQVQKEMEGLRKDSQLKFCAIGDGYEQIRKLLEDNRDLVASAHQVMSSTEESLGRNANQDELDRLTRAVQNLRFIAGNVKGVFCGRLDGYIDKWELVDTINFPTGVEYPVLVGLVNDSEVALSEGGFNGKLYVANLDTKEIDNVIQSERKEQILTCTALPGNVVACGKYIRDCTGDSINRCISVYDRQWKLIRDMAIPRNTPDIPNDAWVYVDTASDGMIVAAEGGTSTIYVIDPADGSTVRTIPLQSKLVQGRIQALATGDVVVKTGRGEFTAIRRSGSEDSVQENQSSVAFSVDQLTNEIYITRYDKERRVYLVNQTTGQPSNVATVEYANHDHPYVFGCSLITSSGKLICCDGNQILIYKKSVVFTEKP